VTDTVLCLVTDAVPWIVLEMVAMGNI